MNIKSHPIHISMTLKRVLFILILIIPKIASAQLELFAKANKDGSLVPVINYNGRKALNEKISITFFGLVRESWSQALIGIAYSPSEIITLSASAGIEHGKRSPRYSASIFTKSNRNSLLILGELGSGKSNYLYRINAFRQFNDEISLGLSAWRYHGIGPNFRYFFSQLYSTFWLMPAYDYEIKQTRLIIGVSFKM